MKPIKSIKRISVWTLISNGLIIVAGYPPTFLLLAGILSLPAVFDGTFLSLTGYDQRALPAALLSLAGEILLLIFILKKEKKASLLYPSLISMWLGFILIASQAFSESEDQVSLISGLPFFFLSMALFRNFRAHVRT